MEAGIGFVSINLPTQNHGHGINKVAKLTCSDLVAWKNVDPKEQSLFGDEGTTIIELEKLVKALTNGWEHAEDQKAVRVMTPQQ